MYQNRGNRRQPTSRREIDLDGRLTKEFRYFKTSTTSVGDIRSEQIGLSDLDTRISRGSDSIFQPKNIFTCILPAVYFFKAVGLVCFSVVKNKNREITFQVSRLGSFYNVVLILAMIALVPISGYALMLTYTTSRNGLNFEFYCDLYPLWAAQLTLIMSMLGAQNQRKFISTLKRLDDIDSKLGLNQIQLPHKRNQTFVVLTLTGGISVFSSMAIMKEYISPGPPGMYTIGKILSSILECVAECHFMFWIQAMKQRFHLINTRLQKSGPTGVSLIEDLADIHASSCRIVGAVNDLFASQLLLIMVTSFGNILVNSYYAILYGVVRDDYKCFTVGSVRMIVFFVWTTCLCASCDKLTEEATATGVYVHDLLRKCSDPKLGELLMNFSNQLLQHKASISAGGFFSLDLNLIYCIVGAVTTYLIILVQFKLSAESKNDSTKVDSSNITSMLT